MEDLEKNVLWRQKKSIINPNFTNDPWKEAVYLPSESDNTQFDQ